MNAPSGLQMMLKAMGIEFDPKMFTTMTEAVVEIRDRLRRIEEKLDKQLSGNESTENSETSGVPAKVHALPENHTQEKSRATNRS